MERVQEQEVKSVDYPPMHNTSVEETLQALHTTTQGLTEQEAAKRIEAYGLNKLPETEPQSRLVRFLYQFHNVLIYLLLGAAVITLLLEYWVDTVVILAVVLINALIGFIQEGKAERAIESIRKMLSLDAMVIRGGRRKKIAAEKLVPGDIVILEPGDRVPADLRLTDVKNLKIEESVLTGESIAVEKKSAPVTSDAMIADRKCIAYSGTSVVYGRGHGVVIETGSQTELGKINRMITEVEKITTPLLRQIAQFGKTLSVIILTVSTLLFIIGYFFTQFEVDELFMAVISLAVAAIPEGLPAIMTITLAIGVQAMAGRNAIIRKLPSVETLGSVTVICTDKTGTLTRNEMTVKKVITAGTTYQVDGAGYEPVGSIRKNGGIIDPKAQPVLLPLIQTIQSCNDASLYEEDGQWKMDGDPTEGALITLGFKAGLDSFNPPRLDQIPFESEHRYMATLNKINGKSVLSVKGAPERLIPMCQTQLSDDGEQPIDGEFWKQKTEELAGQGYRVMAAAMRKSENASTTIGHHDLENLVFLGVIGIIDPPRPEAIEAIKKCREAGIVVKMITGDHIRTALAIGHELGIGDGLKAISGADLEHTDSEELKYIAGEYDIFARTSPEHKLKLVKALQAQNRICAMTGDGVNDAPALKRADVGIAMGIKGTEVTKEASEMVLADDNFASIANAVEEGRRIYDNLRKAILFIIPTNGAQSMVIMAAVLTGTVLPVTPVQILWVNMVTAVTLALALSFEQAEPNVMRRPPRDTNAPILGGYFIWRIGLVSFLIGGMSLGVYSWLMQQGYDIDIARTLAVNTLVAGQLFYLFNCRRMFGPAWGKGFWGNKTVFIAGAVLIGLQLLFTYAPIMQVSFGTDSIGLVYWSIPIGSGIIVFSLVETEKFLVRQFG